MPPPEAFGSSFRRSSGATFLERNAALARAAAAHVVEAPRDRRSRRSWAGSSASLVEGVEVVLDAAHNADAWRTLAAELPPRYVAVVSVSLDKPPAELRVALEGAVAMIATSAWPGRSIGAAELAAVVGGEAIDDPRAATRAGPRAGPSNEACRSSSSARPIS